MKTKITVTRAGGDEPSEPEVDWEAFARTDGSAVFWEGGFSALYERIDGRWGFRHDARGAWSASTNDDDDIAHAIRVGLAHPVHIDIAWRPIK